MPTGKVYLIGAGPGDPGLLTVKGLDMLRKAEVVVYDRLIHPSILAHALESAELIYVGKASSAHTMAQDEINRLLVSKAKSGKTVVRLKGGDPFVFGRGGEEAEILVEEGIEFEIVPGVSSATAVPAYAGIPVTHRGVASSFAVITGHAAESTSSIGWDRIADGADTLVFVMGMENLSRIAAGLVERGRNPSTPVAVIRMGTGAKQETVIGMLGNIVEKVEAANLTPPAVVVVGEVVSLRERLRWFDNRPLFGKRILVTRSRNQASVLSALLREQGADPIEFPVIKIVPPSNYQPLDDAIRHIDTYDWLIFTSANGVEKVKERLEALSLDVRSLKGPKIGVIGLKTGQAVGELGMRVDFMPSNFIAEAVVDEFPEDLHGKRVLILRAEEARDVLPEGLIERGAFVEVIAAYRTEIEDIHAGRVKQMLMNEEIDAVTFTSSSTVRNFIKLVGEAALVQGAKVACIGSVTAQTAEMHGVTVDVVADESTIEGLVEGLKSLWRS